MARALPRLLPADRLAPVPTSDAPWRVESLFGRLIELSGIGPRPSLSFAFDAVRQAQREGEPVAWISARDRTFFPPDAAEAGVDLEALAVVLAPDAGAMARAADRLLRSGAFGLVVIDFAEPATIPTPLLSRLVSLAKHHDTALLCTTEKPEPAPSLGSLVSLRVEASRARQKEGFTATLRALKDKRRGPGWTHSARFRGPLGMR